ncbi:hypothetical protein [Paludisphaera mucosa]|uniref:Uncharacterized protein n=1 Tax=Paludisphaera mucosa TaxID=3030827 RepID=A0ABT6FBR8_9BACT|nr:hypothetical protein [Paludisphaera mucosa]MDG3005032.1 hypothetical protein [Paludisphaera mucosa]
MSTDAKSPEPPPSTVTVPRSREKGIKIFMWPKVIYIFPSALVALICAMGMYWLPHKAYDATVPPEPVLIDAKSVDPNAPAPVQNAPGAPMTRRERFNTPQNLLGLLFLVVLAFNLVVMGLDFPRFELIGIILAVLFGIFFVLWLGAYFDLDLMRPINQVLASVYTFANAGFYLMYALAVLAVLVIVYITRWLDYWEILPNEILHHHGPLSDLERFPTMNLKFDKEIPDVLEYLMLGAGRLVLRVPNVDRAIILENVLFIGTKEEALKRLMSRLDVRITTDKDDPLV